MCDPFGVWNREIEIRNLRNSYGALANWRISHPNENPVHNHSTLRERLCAYRARATIHSSGLPINDPANASHLNYIQYYNNFLANNNPPFLNESVPL